MIAVPLLVAAAAVLGGGPAADDWSDQPPACAINAAQRLARIALDGLGSGPPFIGRAVVRIRRTPKEGKPSERTETIYIGPYDFLLYERHDLRRDGSQGRKDTVGRNNNSYWRLQESPSVVILEYVTFRDRREAELTNDFAGSWWRRLGDICWRLRDFGVSFGQNTDLVLRDVVSSRLEGDLLRVTSYIPWESGRRGDESVAVWRYADGMLCVVEKEWRDGEPFRGRGGLKRMEHYRAIDSRRIPTRVRLWVWDTESEREKVLAGEPIEVYELVELTSIPPTVEYLERFYPKIPPLPPGGVLQVKDYGKNEGADATK